MPDRTKDPAKKRASNARRQARFQARQRDARLAVANAAEAVRREALDAARVAKGLPPVPTSTQKSIARRARQAEQRAREAREAEAVRAQQDLDAEVSALRWDEPWFPGGAVEAHAYLARIHPNESAELIGRLVEKLTVDCAIAGLPLNRYVCFHLIADTLAAKLRDETLGKQHHANS